jgi:diaminohydroxyphosphoribosylaminopyrimidine deaminase / 5-amino-6-(5-phosphoribosylamino)uracil reductase
MHRCLQLAQNGIGKVAPNPLVGAVLVHNNTVIGQGWHAQYGQAHAEVNCIASVAENKKHLVSQSTMYVCLEPCAHHGKTPPCTDLIIANKIPEVVIACTDSFSAVNGKGIARLMAAGVKVQTQVLQNEAIELNKRFFTFNEKKRPYITLKWAQTADKKVAGLHSERLFISNDISNRLVHEWRSQEAAILVGTNTVIKDNPTLTTRLVEGYNPIRLVIDKQLVLSKQSKVFNTDAKTIVFNNLKDDTVANVAFIKFDVANNFAKEILSKLYQLNIQSVIVEGGTKLLQSFIDENIWDEARIITNTQQFIGEGLHAPVLQHAQITATHKYANDTIAFFTNPNR